MIEPQSFEEEDEVLPSYQPEHPMLSFKVALSAPKRDHLANYVEVDPFAVRETKQQTSEQQTSGE